MKYVFVAFALFVAVPVFAQETIYVERSDVESGKVVVTGPAGQPRVVVVYPVGCKPPYVPKFGGGCHLPVGYYNPGYPTPFSSYFHFQYRR